jgi:acetyltransferase-like isoleucine patch superfamily enzyme
LKKIHENVTIGPESEIEDFVIIGRPPKGAAEGSLITTIGKKAHIRSHTIIYSGNKIGDNFQTGHSTLIRENNSIGNDVSIGSGSVVEHDTKIGNKVRIHSKAFVPEYSVLEDGCWLGPNVVLTNVKYPLGTRSKQEIAGVTIGAGAKIGANSTILPGVKIGKNSLVGAGSVVTKDVPENIVVAGNPARKIKDVADLKYEDEERPYE